MRLRVLGMGAVLLSIVGGAAPAARGQQAGAPSTVTPAARDGAALALHESFLKRAQEGPIELLFLGDSITQGWHTEIWKRYYGARKAANFGIGGDRTQHVLWRMAHGEIEGIDPKVVVLMIGTNNIGSNPPEEIATGVETIVTTLRSKLPHAKILLLGVFPRGANRETDRPAAEPDGRIAQVNERIKTLADGKMITYLDIGPKFLDAEGRIPRTIMPDFLHLSRAGYQIWAEAMEPTLWELLQAK
jgi:lysophospholipase L1-like esterase